MVAPQSDELQSAFFAQLDPKLTGDGRIRAAWLEGSFGRGDADRYSDIDLHLLLTSDDAAAFRKTAETWLASIRPLVLFKWMFGDSMINALTVDGLRIDIWLHEGMVAKGSIDKVHLLHAVPDAFTLTDGSTVNDSGALATMLEEKIREFWRCIALLPSVLGRGELIVGQMGIAIELRLLTDILVDGYEVKRDAGVKKLNGFLPGDTRQALENALSLNRLSERSAALTHLRLAAIMQQHGPAIGVRHKFAYPNELENAVIAHVIAELEHLGHAQWIAETEIATSQQIR